MAYSMEWETSQHGLIAPGYPLNGKKIKNRCKMEMPDEDGCTVQQLHGCPMGKLLAATAPMVPTFTIGLSFTPLTPGGSGMGCTWNLGLGLGLAVGPLVRVCTGVIYSGRGGLISTCCRRS